MIYYMCKVQFCSSVTCALFKCLTVITLNGRSSITLGTIYWGPGFICMGLYFGISSKDSPFPYCEATTGICSGALILPSEYKVWTFCCLNTGNHRCSVQPSPAYSPRNWAHSENLYKQSVNLSTVFELVTWNLLVSDKLQCNAFCGLQWFQCFLRFKKCRISNSIKWFHQCSIKWFLSKGFTSWMYVVAYAPTYVLSFLGVNSCLVNVTRNTLVQF